MYKNCCGIDFGTTNSAISVLKGQNIPQLAMFHNNKQTIPTAIFFPEENTYKPIFGTPAINEYINGSAGRFMRSLKRILGTDLMTLKTEVNGIRLSYEDIILKFVKYLKIEAETQSHTELKNVVLGRPVHFQDFAPDADKKAESLLYRVARNAGFRDISFQYEPLAAAYAHEIKLESEQLACVIDIGGGTSDFSVIMLGPENRKKKDRTSDILANTGVRIGGNDFDRDLAIKCYMPIFGYKTDLKPDEYSGRILPVPSSPYAMLSEWSDVNNLYTYKEKKNVKHIYKCAAEPEKVGNLYEIVEKELGHILLHEVESGKIRLTTEKHLRQKLSFLQYEPEICIDSEEFEESIACDTEKILKALKECLQESGVENKKVSLVILTGGSTEIPYIKKAIMKMFPAAKVSEDEKLASVAIGLSYDALNKYNDE